MAHLATYRHFCNLLYVRQCENSSISFNRISVFNKKGIEINLPHKTADMSRSILSKIFLKHNKHYRLKNTPIKRIRNVSRGLLILGEWVCLQCLFCEATSQRLRTLQSGWVDNSTLNGMCKHNVYVLFKVLLWIQPQGNFNF